ncbi:DUF1259 domain-containing protein [Pseudalkalibacillus caeni]|uniref:DUF1259 domain-containing protein n=1 Tax=Exobacillus caeni TaxID=2574798 RepID=A0A5R9F2X8_9BACL|nr:DUF1259 domain-containing protein [Pseudalkalibacillus caeni]TLS37411.1 DUF1259 domain-containing protein [Pseudalkalibacillus caeni]
MSAESIQGICNEFGRILNGKANVDNGVCSVNIKRNLHVEIQGRPSKAELEAALSFESMDQYGRALNLGETVLLTEEVNPFMDVIKRNGILISALHNHWLFTSPNILYLHFQSVEPPLHFASKVAEAFKVLKY